MCADRSVVVSKRFLSGKLDPELKHVWNHVFEIISMDETIDRVVWSVDPLNDEAGLAIYLGSEQDPGARRDSTPVVTVFFPECYEEICDRLIKVGFDEDEEKHLNLCSELEKKVDKWVIDGIKGSWKKYKILKMNKVILRVRKIGIFVADSAGSVRSLNYNWICGNRIPVQLTLAARLESFCRDHGALSPWYHFVVKDGRKICELDFSDIEPFQSISSKMVDSLGDLLKDHSPKKLYLNNDTNISKETLSKFEDFFGIKKAIRISNDKSDRRYTAIDLALSAGKAAWLEKPCFDD